MLRLDSIRHLSLCFLKCMKPANYTPNRCVCHCWFLLFSAPLYTATRSGCSRCGHFPQVLNAPHLPAITSMERKGNVATSTKCAFLNVLHVPSVLFFFYTVRWQMTHRSCFLRSVTSRVRVDEVTSRPCARLRACVCMCVCTGMLAVAIKLASDRVCAKTFPGFCVRHKNKSRLP